MSRPRLLAALCLLSGAFGINYEVLYYRLITARFGDMLHVHAAVLATFLLGIAVGARVAGRARRHLWLMEVLVGASALAVSGALEVIDGSLALKVVGTSAPLTVLVCMALVALPAVLVGMSVPLFSDYLSRAVDEGAFRRTYALYNLGAVVSVLAVEYLLVRTLGHRTSLYTIAAGNMAVGALLFGLFPGHRTLPAATKAPHRLERTSLVWGLVVLGVASSIFQMCFVRTSIDILGPHREVFALTLALVLVGLPLGTLLARRVSLATTLAVAGVAVCAGMLLADVWIAHAVVGLVAFTCFGAVLPIVLATRGDDGDVVGHAMWASGLGNAAGYLLYVLAVSPVFSAAGQRLVVMLTLALGLALATHRRRAPLIALAAASLLLLGARPVAERVVPADPNARIAGALPALYVEQARTACVLGAGATAAAATSAFARVDTIDLSPAADPAVIHDDPRVFLLDAGPYDAIVNTTDAATSKLHTTEFFRRAKAALAPGGVYTTRIGPGVREPALRAIVGSLRNVFRRCAGTRLAHGDLFLACGDGDLTPRTGHIRGDHLHLEGDFLRTVDPQGLENTDDLPVSEFVAR